MTKNEVLQKIAQATDLNQAMAAIMLAGEHCPSLLGLAMMGLEVRKLKIEAAELRTRANLKEIEMAGVSFNFMAVWNTELKKDE